MLSKVIKRSRRKVGQLSGTGTLRLPDGREFESDYAIELLQELLDGEAGLFDHRACICVADDTAWLHPGETLELELEDGRAFPGFLTGMCSPGRRVRFEFHDVSPLTAGLL